MSFDNPRLHTDAKSIYKILIRPIPEEEEDPDRTQGMHPHWEGQRLPVGEVVVVESRAINYIHLDLAVDQGGEEVVLYVNTARYPTSYTRRGHSSNLLCLCHLFTLQNYSKTKQTKIYSGLKWKKSVGLFISPRDLDCLSRTLPSDR